MKTRLSRTPSFGNIWIASINAWRVDHQLRGSQTIGWGKINLYHYDRQKEKSTNQHWAHKDWSRTDIVKEVTWALTTIFKNRIKILWVIGQVLVVIGQMSLIVRHMSRAIIKKWILRLNSKVLRLDSKENIKKIK